MTTPWYLLALAGAGASIARIVFGWLSESVAEGTVQPFSWWKAVRTLIAAAISGAFIGVYAELPLKGMVLSVFAGTIVLDDLVSRVAKLARM